MNRSGHIIVLRPDIDLKNYETADFMQKNLHYLKKLRDIFEFITPSKYRGTGREHFNASPFFVDKEGQLQTWPDSHISDYKNLEARRRFAILENKISQEDTPEDLCFYSLQEIKQVYGLIEDKGNYEIIQFIELFAVTNENTLGFDVGFLADDYSVIADTAIKPTWHPPVFSDMQDIIEHLKLLNEHCLFPTLEQAEAFRDTYLTKDWGEKESYERQITTFQVRIV
jgi:hypothetical protein